MEIQEEWKSGQNDKNKSGNMVQVESSFPFPSPRAVNNIGVMPN